MGGGESSIVRRKLWGAFQSREVLYYAVTQGREKDLSDGQAKGSYPWFGSFRENERRGRLEVKEGITTRKGVSDEQAETPEKGVLLRGHGGWASESLRETGEV